VLTAQGLFFSGTAVVTLGGAYAVLASVRPVAVAITVVALVLVFALRWPVLRVLGVCAGLGLIAGLTGLPVA
jgi:chromate transporter